MRSVHNIKTRSLPNSANSLCNSESRESRDQVSMHPHVTLPLDSCIVRLLVVCGVTAISIQPGQFEQLWVEDPASLSQRREVMGEALRSPSHLSLVSCLNLPPLAHQQLFSADHSFPGPTPQVEAVPEGPFDVAISATKEDGDLAQFLKSKYS